MCVYKNHAFIYFMRPPRWQSETIPILLDKKRLADFFPDSCKEMRMPRIERYYHQNIPAVIRDGSDSHIFMVWPPGSSNSAAGSAYFYHRLLYSLHICHILENSWFFQTMTVDNNCELYAEQELGPKSSTTIPKCL